MDSGLGERRFIPCRADLVSWGTQLAMMQAIPRHPKHSDRAKLKAGYSRSSCERLDIFVAVGVPGAPSGTARRSRRLRNLTP
jgi:hypothetical protein